MICLFFSRRFREPFACLMTVQLVAHHHFIRHDRDNHYDDDNNNNDDNVDDDGDAICPVVCIEKGKTEQFI